MSGPAAAHPRLATAHPRLATARRLVRRHRAVAGALLVVAVLAVLAAALRPGGGGGPLGTAEAGPDGSLALARLLDDRGVRVRAAESGPAALHALSDPGSSTVLVAAADRLSADLTRRLVDSGARVVLVAPASRQLDAGVSGVRTAGSATAPAAEPGCDLRAARQAGSVDLSGSAYAVRSPGQPGTGAGRVTACYPASSGALLVRVAGDGARAEVDVLGSARPLRNDQLAGGGAAALALDLLGERPTLVWYRPAAADSIEPGQPGRPLTDLLPGWVRPVELQLAVAALLFALARARRIGPVVPERLPVVVAAGETTAGRARLYRRHRARDAAARALRAAAVRDLAARVGQPLRPGPDRTAAGAGAGPVPVAPGVIAAVAARSGLSPPVVADLLTGPDPRDDDALVRLTRELADLTERTRRT